MSVLMVVLTASFLYFGFIGKMLTVENVKIPDAAIGLAEKPLSSILQSSLPELSLDQPLSAIVSSKVGELEERGVPKEAAGILGEGRVPTEKEIEEILKVRPDLAPQLEQRQTSSQGFTKTTEQTEVVQGDELMNFLLGVAKTDPSASVLDGIIMYTNKQIQTMLKPYEYAIPIVVTLLYFFVLKGFASIVRWIIPGTVWLVVHILKVSGFIKEQKETVEITTLTL